MGVLYDYFRAPNPSAATLFLDQPGTFDTLPSKGIDPTVTLGKLVALARGDEWSTSTVAADAIWPPRSTRPTDDEGWASLPEDSPWMNGPWIEELDDRTRDTLADLDLALAGRWALIEEFDDRYSSASSLASLTSFVTALSGLAGRARDAGERLYCWSCV